MEIGKILKRFRKHELWAIGVTLALHIVILGWLLFTNLARVREQEEYELLLEAVKEQKEKLEKMEETVQEKAEKAVQEILTHTPSKMIEEGELENERTTEQLEEDFQEKVTEQEIQEKIVEEYRSPEIEPVAEKKEKDKSISEAEKQQHIFYVGKSSVAYYLKNRYRVKLPIPIYQCKGGGQVEVAIVVDRTGTVTEAKVVKQRSRSASDCMKEAALQAALTSVFSKDTKAKEEQQGRIVYKFVPQE